MSVSEINEQLIPRYDVLTSPEKYVGYVWEGIYNRGREINNADPVAYANGRLLGNNGIGSGYNMWDAATGGDLIDPATRTVRAGVNRVFTPESYAAAAFGTGFRTETNLRMGGGSEKSKYFASLGYLDDKGYSVMDILDNYFLFINSLIKFSP